LYPKFCAVAVAALALMPLGAADFWQEKKFSEWSEKQARRILDDSPWARPVAISDGRRGGMRSGDGGGRDLSDDTSPSPSRAPRRGGSRAQPPEAPPAVMSVLRWHTALPVKQAVARIRFGDAAETAPDAVKMLSREEKQYVLGVTNLPGSVLREGKDSLKPNIRLRLKGKPEIPVADIQTDRQGNRLTLYLFFPKGQEGNPVIEASDGEVEVVMKLGEMKISRKFKLKEMMFGGKLEI
jgi:hypothetical protein